MSLLVCVASAHGDSLRTACSCSPCHEPSRLCMSGVMCMAACCWGPRDHCLLLCRHTHTRTLLTLCWKGESRSSGWGHAMLLFLVIVVCCYCHCCCCVCYCCLLSLCCVASCCMAVLMLMFLLLLHRWPRCCPARHVEACTGWSGWVRLLHP